VSVVTQRRVAELTAATHTAAQLTAAELSAAKDATGVAELTAAELTAAQARAAKAEAQFELYRTLQTEAAKALSAGAVQMSELAQKLGAPVEIRAGWQQ
jgi:hypothetical protein